MSPAMKRTGCLILPPAFWKMLFVFLAAFLDQEMAQEKRLSTNRMGRWACLGGFFMIEANCLHVCMFLFFKNLFGGSPHRSMSQVCLKRIQVAPSFDSNLTELQGGTKARLQLPPKYREKPVTSEYLTSFRGHIWRYSIWISREKYMVSAMFRLVTTNIRSEIKPKCPYVSLVLRMTFETINLIHER